ncbi:hypothetical protein CG395_05415, partial [Bifidobacteriaceae bacterium GH022]
ISRALRSSKSSIRTRISCANVFAAQKQCFCLERLSESKCIRALRFKRKSRSSQTKKAPAITRAIRWGTWTRTKNG